MQLTLQYFVGENSAETKIPLTVPLLYRPSSNTLTGSMALPTSIFPDNPPSTLGSAIMDQIALTTTQIVPAVWNTPDGQRGLMNASDVTATIDGHIVPPHSALAE